eukprot:symbB.v1.2.028181.t1/scaffold2963.1/size66434/2
MKWCGFQEPVGLGFLQTSARTSKENGISCRSQTVLAAGGMGLIFGLMAFGHQKSHHGCECEVELTDAQKKLPEELKKLLGAQNVSSNVTLRGSRLGKGTALLVAKPLSLREALQTLEICAKANVAILPQGANTSLTGGSVPRDDCDRPFVIINMRRAKKILPVGSKTPEFALCFAGAGIYQLQSELQKRDRDSHSVLGSIFLNPSVAAGVSYGSGGTQIRKGPAFTNRALFCRVQADGKVELVDTLGLKVKGEKALDFLDSAETLTEGDLDPSCKSAASWPKYPELLTKVEDKVSRFNADTTGADCNRSEGKVLILATLHDTFPMPKEVKTVWASCKDVDLAHKLKREVCISSPNKMAKSCEYINKATYDAVDQSGRILIKMIEVLGMMNLETLWNLKLFIESVPVPFSTIICDKFLWWFNNILPKSTWKCVEALFMLWPTSRVQHNLRIKSDRKKVYLFLTKHRGNQANVASQVKDVYHPIIFGAALDPRHRGEIEDLLSRLKKFQSQHPETVRYHVCEDPRTAQRAMLFRFAVAPAFRTYCIGLGQQGLSIDYALPKTFVQYPILPEAQYPIMHRLVYSHFGCNVYHEDFVFDNNTDVHDAKMAIKKAIEKVGGKLPAEHGHGTEYKAPLDTQQRWMKADPSNTMNPGVGGTSFKKNYA